MYHTNVMLTIGDTFAVICLESIKNKSEQTFVKNRLESTGHEIIDISFAQMNAFAGNMLQVQNTDEGKTFLVMSATSLKSLTPEQIAQIEKHTSILSVEIPTMETVAAAVRCMLAEIILPKIGIKHLKPVAKAASTAGDFKNDPERASEAGKKKAAK